MRIPQMALSALFAALLAGPALADRHGNNECPVGYVTTDANGFGVTLDQEFGPGTQDLTRCLERRHNVKMVVQINQTCASSSTDKACLGDATKRAFALENIENILADYEITHGMRPGKDFEIVAVVHSGGGNLILKDGSLNGTGGTNTNKQQPLVEKLIAEGVKFYFCQNTTRGFIKNGTLPAGNATAQMIDGVEYSTAGLTSIADFEALGYQYIQP